MTTATTLLQLAGADLNPAKIKDACLVLIDMQNEYREGPIAVTGADQAVGNAVQLLEAARAQGAPLFHIAHRGRAGGLFDRDADRGQIVAPLSPLSSETVIEKQLPNAFSGTDLAEQVKATGRSELILCGFMTHMCVSSTARAALDLGFRITVDASACATRDLPDGNGGVISAAVVHNVALAELSDRFAVIAPDNRALI